MKRSLYLTYLRTWGPALVVPTIFLLLSFSANVVEVCYCFFHPAVLLPERWKLRGIEGSTGSHTYAIACAA